MLVGIYLIKFEPAKWYSNTLVHFTCKLDWFLIPSNILFGSQKVKRATGNYGQTISWVQFNSGKKFIISKRWEFRHSTTQPKNSLQPITANQHAWLKKHQWGPNDFVTKNSLSSQKTILVKKYARNFIPPIAFQSLFEHCYSFIYTAVAQNKQKIYFKSDADCCLVVHIR